VINEIMYNPFGLDREYVELRNVTDADLTLDGWRFSDGINFTFSPGSTIAANGHVLIVPIDPATFRSTYNIPANVAIFGPYTGALDNGGEKVTLARPGTPVGAVTPYITVDRVNYDNETPWPSLPDGQGPSVARVDAVKYGNDPGNWRPDLTDGTPGLANGLAPLVFTSTFTYPTLGPTITIKFNKDVGASLVKTDLVLRNLTTDQTIDLSSAAFAYDPATQTATWTLPATLADGNYRATLAATAVTDAQGRQLDGNADGTAGDDFTTDFFHLTGDINHDRSVDFLDLATLAQNYNSTSGGMTWAQGDFNGDGNVDFLDLAKLAQNYNTSLPAPAPAAPAAPAPAPSPAAPVVSAASAPMESPAPVTAEVSQPAVAPPTPTPTPTPTKKKAKPAPIVKSKPVTKAVPKPAVQKPVVKQLPPKAPTRAVQSRANAAPSVIHNRAVFSSSAITRRKSAADLFA
jgi:hypothetical protein